MKMIVETTGPFMLMDVSGGQSIAYDRPSVVKRTSFVEMKVARGDVRILAGEVPDAATDGEFAGFWVASDGDAELAVASYVSKFEAPAEEPEKPRRGAKARS